MIPCQFCGRNFAESLIGLTEKTFHELIHHPDEVNAIET